MADNDIFIQLPNFPAQPDLMPAQPQILPLIMQNNFNMGVETRTAACF